MSPKLPKLPRLPKLTEEFKEFMNSSEHSPSPSLNDKISEVVHRELNPSGLKVFTKLMAIHVFVAALTLMICPQFGFRLAGEGMGLMTVFMAFGQTGCMIACGSFFTGLSLLVASIALRGEEIRKIRHNRILELGALTVLSMGFFIMVDAELIFSLVAAWFLGAFVGSFASLEIGWFLRLKFKYQK